MTEPARWIVDAQPVLALADWPEGVLAALVDKLNLQALAALAQALIEREAEQESA